MNRIEFGGVTRAGLGLLTLALNARIKIRATAGTVESLDLLERGQVDMVTRNADEYSNHVIELMAVAQSTALLSTLEGLEASC